MTIAASQRLDQQLAWLIARANRRIEEELAERLRPSGLSIEQFRILEALEEGGPATMGRLADVALVEKPTLTKIVDRMVVAGLVFRHPDETDRRRVNIRISHEGAALYRRFEAAGAEQERRVAARLGVGGRDEAAIRAFLDAFG